MTNNTTTTRHATVDVIGDSPEGFDVFADALADVPGVEQTGDPDTFDAILVRPAGTHPAPAIVNVFFGDTYRVRVVTVDDEPIVEADTPAGNLLSAAAVEFRFRGDRAAWRAKREAEGWF